MTDVLSVLWTIISFILGIIWSLVWFILSDLISTVLWVFIVIWLGFALRHRSFTLGSLAMLRYAPLRHRHAMALGAGAADAGRPAAPGGAGDQGC